MTRRLIRETPHIYEQRRPSAGSATKSVMQNIHRIDALELGTFGVYDKVLQELGFRQAVEIGLGDDGDIPADVALRCLVQSRLAGEKPSPLSRISEWLSSTILPTWYGVSPEKVNEYRLGRLLEKLPDQMEAIWATLITNAHQRYELDVKDLVGDGTTVTFAGKYEGSELATRGREPDVKQMLLTLNVTSRHGIPVVWDIFPGNTTDNTTVCGNVTKIVQMAERLGIEPSDIVTWGDRGRLNYDIIRAYHRDNVKYIGSMQVSKSQTELIDTVSDTQLFANPLTYETAKGVKLCYGHRTTMTIPATSRGKKVKDAVEIEEPALVVFLPELKESQRADREKNLGRYWKRLEQIASFLNNGNYCKKTYAEAQLKKAETEYSSVSKLVAWTLTGEDKNLTMSLTRLHDACEHAGRYDGRFVVLFNCPHLSDEEIIRRLRGRNIVEQTIGDLKGTIEVAPIYLHDDRRIKGLIFICMVALLVQSIVVMLLARAKLQMTARKLNAALKGNKASVLTMTDGSVVLHIPQARPQEAFLLRILDSEQGKAEVITPGEDSYLRWAARLAEARGS